MDFQTLLILTFLLIILPIVLIVLFFLFRGMWRSEKETQITDKAESPKPSQLQQPAELEPVARLWHDPSRGNLVVEIGEQMFREVGDLNLDQYHRLVDSHEDMRKWLGIPAPESLPVRAKPEPSEQFEAHPQPSEQDGLISQPQTQDPPVDGVTDPAFSQQTTVEQESQFQEPQPNMLASQEVPTEPVRPSINPINVFARALLPQSGTQTPNLNVVAQINDILQENLEGTSLKQRGIRLVERPDHSMVVMIGLEKYDSVDDVPDEQVQDVIRQAVSEWEDQMIGGES